jgi:hypothetical protein
MVPALYDTAIRHGNWSLSALISRTTLKVNIAQSLYGKYIQASIYIVYISILRVYRQSP